MKKYLLILPLVFLSCENSDDYFAKKQECAEHLASTEEEVFSLGLTSEANFRDVEVFYSPSLDTCVSTYILYKDDTFLAFSIKNILTGEDIYSKTFFTDEIDSLYKQGLLGKQEEEYQAKKEDLKKE